MDKSKKKLLETFIYPGVECVVISGYRDTHWFPIGTVVKVMTELDESMWDCYNNKLCLYQIVEAKDLVVVE